MLKQSQSQKLLQKTLPQIIQKQSLLAVPTLSIEQMVKLEIEMNPFLEEELEEPSIEEAEDTAKEDIKEEVDKTDEEFDTDDFQNSETDGYKTEDYEYTQKNINYDNLWKSRVSLSDNLRSQLHLSGLNEKEIYIGELLIGNLNDEGYLRENIEDVKLDIDRNKIGTEFENEIFNTIEISEVLKVIQHLEPIGIASRNLKECLLIQIDEFIKEKYYKSLCKKVLNEYFEEFRLKNFEKLMKELQVDIEVVNKIFDLIGKLNPKPGLSEDVEDNHYIFPDLIVRKENNEYKVELNDKHIPAVKLNNMYLKLAENNKNSSDKSTKEFVKNNYERARWFLDAIKSRRLTMLKVMNAILKRQIEFFDNMGENLKPMYEKDIADDINMDISTISRTVRGKYVQTSFGIYELKQFFSNYIRNEEGDDVSTTEIKNKLREIVESENPKSPLTDDELTNELNKAGFKIARRTVAKYREALKIAKARLRRKIN